MSIDLAASYAETFADRASVLEYGEGQLFTTPLHLTNGESIAFYVEQQADDYFYVTDRGLAADSLAEVNLDLDSPKGKRHWDALRRSIDAQFPMMREVGRYELCAGSDAAGMGETLHRLTEAVLRGDALRVLGQVKAVSFKERAIRSAAEEGLIVRPGAKVQTKFGAGVTREVSFAAEGSREVFVQAISGVDGMIGIDHARVILGDAEVAKENRVSLIAQRAKVTSWQIGALEDVGVVVHEATQAAYWRSLSDVA